MRLTRLGAPLAILALFAFTPSAAQAQGAWLFLGGGVTIPVSDYGDVSDAGWLATGGIGVDLGDSGAWLAADGFYGRNGGSEEALELVDFSLYGVLGELGYTFGTAGAVRPYVFGGGGLLVLKADPEGETVESDSESQFGYIGAAGITIPAGESLSFWIEGRYMGSSDVNLFGGFAGISVDLGG